MCLREKLAHPQLMDDLIGLRVPLASNWSRWSQWGVRRVFLRVGEAFFILLQESLRGAVFWFSLNVTMSGSKDLNCPSLLVL